MNENTSNNSSPIEETKASPVLLSFSPQFWLVILFEFFERGAYYGMFSVLSVYLTDILHFSREQAGVINGTFQPILYFLPIISGALADRFGYRRTLIVAFGLLGTGYFLSSQMTGYATIFLSLCLMAIGAGTFKPIISSSIARLTTAGNSSIGFGIYYWSINLGAFLFPLILVPFLKNNIGWNWVLIASAIGTGAMLIPAIFFFKEPPKPQNSAAKNINLIQTLANAFEIIYSPFILIYHLLKSASKNKILIYLLLGLTGIFALWSYWYQSPVEEKFTAHIVQHNQTQLIIQINRNIGAGSNYSLQDQYVTTVDSFNLTISKENRNGSRELFQPLKKDGFDLNFVLYTLHLDSIMTLLDTEFSPYFKISRAKLDTIFYRLKYKSNNRISLNVFKPEKLDLFKGDLLEELHSYPDLADITDGDIANWIGESDSPIKFSIEMDKNCAPNAPEIKVLPENQIFLKLYSIPDYEQHKLATLKELRKIPQMSLLSLSQLSTMVQSTTERSFLLFFMFLLLVTSLIILKLQSYFQRSSNRQKIIYILLFCLIIGLISWFIPGIGTFQRIITTVIYLTTAALFLIDFEDTNKFRDHFRFLLMIFLYSGFWVLYFQMNGTVLWYVKAYVDASSFNQVVNSLLNYLGIHINWFFDVEHVTAINAGIIILLQLIVSNLVKNTKALPTMIAGIFLGTFGMAILAISTGIWVFLIGITIFSIGEMTAHPKFISYIGQMAPRDRVATYMGYIFLYGVIGSSIGSVAGAKLYVHFVDNLHQPKLLWLIFTGFGILTIIGLLIYNRVVKIDENPK